ncbi:MAG: septum formation protein Maf [Clostridia bacterium]|nr:septum formation protein Maf [Clostridia bacterium]
MKIILASASPRRKELLELIVPKFEIMVSGIDEKLEEGLTLQEQVTRLAYAKSKDIYEKTNGDRIIIGSDTIVTKNGKIYGKPKDRNHAKQMIKELLEGDKTHSIITGLSVIVEKEGKYKEYKTYDEVKVFLKDISDKEIDKWIDSGKAMDKAGAYGIQNEFCVFVDKIEGNYTSVVGLPTHKLYDIIKEYIN